MEGVEAVVFDFDGTLVDSFPLIFAGFAHAFHFVHKREPSQAELDAMLGPTETVAIRRLSSDVTIGEQAVAAFFTFFQQHHSEYCAMDPAIAAMLKLLATHAVPVAIFSGRSERCLRLSAECMFGSERFPVLIGGDSVARTKPAPDGLLKAAEHLRVDVADIIYVGDTDGDVALAKSAGARSVRAAWFPTIGQVRVDEQADYHCTSVAGFTRLLAQNFAVIQKNER